MDVAVVMPIKTSDPSPYASVDQTSEEGGSDLVDRTLLRKERRNARDRKRSQLKKDTMEAMRRQVMQLEAEKQRLESSFPGGRVSTNMDELAPTLPTGDALAVAQRRYLDVLQQIEKLRHANRAMALDVLERDLFRSAAQNLLDAMANDDDSNGSSDAANAKPSTPVSPLTQDEALSFAQRTVWQIQAARVESDRMQRFTGAQVFGWSDFRMQTGTTVRFTIQKSFARQSARQLACKTWDLLSDATQLKRVLPPGFRCELRQVQRVNNDAIVIDRITRDPQLERVQQASIRTTYMLVRASGDDSASDRCHVLGMKTIDSPVFKMALSGNEQWCDIFYWFHFEDKMVGDEMMTTVMFGGSLSYFSEAIARLWLAELVFLTVRWETILISSSLLPSA